MLGWSVESSRGLAGGVLREERLSLPGGGAGGRRWEVTGEGRGGELYPCGEVPPPVEPGWGKHGGCRQEAGAAGGACPARKAVLGAVPVRPAAGWGLE